MVNPQPTRPRRENNAQDAQLERMRSRVSGMNVQSLARNIRCTERKLLENRKNVLELLSKSRDLDKVLGIYKQEQRKRKPAPASNEIMCKLMISLAEEGAAAFPNAAHCFTHAATRPGETDNPGQGNNATQSANDTTGNTSSGPVDANSQNTDEDAIQEMLEQYVSSRDGCCEDGEIPC